MKRQKVNKKLVNEFEGWGRCAVAYEPVSEKLSLVTLFDEQNYYMLASNRLNSEKN